MGVRWRDGDSCRAEQAGGMGAKTAEDPERMGSAVCADGVWDGMGCTLAEQLAVSGGAGVPGEIRSSGGGDFLFWGIRRPGEAKTLPGLAGDQLGRGKRRKRRE